MQFIDLKQQYQLIQSKVQQGINKVLEHGQYIMGPEITELEQSLTKFSGAKHALAVSSGTDALLMALMALDITAGDEVITTPFSFIATAETILLLGAKPVFVDIDEKTYNINPALIEQAITKKTKAIMPVSLYGQCADMDAINAIAERHQLPVIEDAAQSFGAQYKQSKSCNLSTIGCTSFFPSKPLGCYGDGGAIFTNDDDLAMKLQQIRVHGQDRRYHHPLIGINGRMDSIQAAVLLTKLELFPDEILSRQKSAFIYDELLNSKVQTPYIQAENISVYAQYTIAVTHREALIEHLKAQEIPTAVHYPVPLHLQPAVNQRINKGNFPIAEAMAEQVVSLPMHPYLLAADQEKIAQAIHSFY